MANPQPTDPHLRVAHRINEEIMASDFSKRQRKILDLVLRLSWGCHKKYAIIPRQKDFAIVGVPETKIKVDLDWLKQAKVLFIEEDEYSFNKNYDQWRVSRAKEYSPEKLTDLVSLNLNHDRPPKAKTELSTTLPASLEAGLPVLGSPIVDNPDVTSEGQVDNLVDNPLIHHPDTSRFGKSLPFSGSPSATKLASFKESIKERIEEKIPIIGGETLSTSEIWKRTVDGLREYMTLSNYQSWIRDSIALGVSGGNFVIAVKSEYIREVVLSRMKPRIEKVLSELTSRRFSIVCIALNENPMLLQVHETTEEVCGEYGVKRSELVAGRRTAEVVTARREIARRLVETTSLPLLEIGRRLGVKDAKRGKGAFDF